MQLQGSCHCGAVVFSLSSAHPYPYQRCYCSICRKTQGGGGYSINLSGAAHSLIVTGRKQVAIYRAKIKREGERRAHTSSAERHFCRLCGSALWLFSPEWPELIHPSPRLSTRRCRCRRNTPTCCSTRKPPGSKSICGPAINNSTATPKNPSPSGMNALV